MALDTTLGDIQVKTRDVAASDYKRDYRVRNPAADTGPNTQPDLDAAVFADGIMPIYNDAQVIGRATLVKSTFGARLNALGASEGVERLGAIGASGAVKIVASAGGGTIFAGDIIRDPNSGLRYQCLATALYLDGSEVPIVGLDTGPSTNVDAGTTLQWQAPRPGIGPDATVVEQIDGTGLTGGADAEQDDAYQDRIIDKRSNPPASGNEAEYIEAASRTPGVNIEAVWAYPGIKGAGTMGIVFTVRPAKLGGSRLPNPTQIALVLGQLVGKFPGDDGIFVATLLSQDVDVALSATWGARAAGWADVAPWPSYSTVRVRVTTGFAGGTTAVGFRLSLASGSTTDPQAGQTIALYDSANTTFRRKKILSVSTVTPGQVWDITVDTSNGTSDTSYVPVTGQAVSPWSDSLSDLVAASLGHFAKLGPGEQVASLPDPGTRQRRVPQSPAKWPSVLTNRLLSAELDAPPIDDAGVLVPTIPLATTVGTPGTISYLMRMNDLAVYKQ